jgi:signal peptide peptidase SppA
MQSSFSLWAIGPDAVHTVLQLMSRNFGKPGDVPMLAHTGAKPSMQGRGNDKIAVIPIHGVLTQDGPAYYGSNYQGIADAVEKAASDPDVKRIILSVDSPGGEVVGLPETASVIARAARVKPVSAIVEGTAASAAYWLASQANEVTLTPSGEVGSVGVRMMHVDMSAMLDKAGYKVTELSAGDFKTEWSPYKPLSDAARADMQTRLQASHKDFIAGVAAGRGRRASAAITKSRFGEGRMFSAEDAVFHGLVDRLQSPRSFMRAAIAGAPPTPSNAATRGTSADFDLSVIRARLDLALLRA